MPSHLKGIILVDTIEKFQGSERSIIFYSTTVNTKAQLEKLQSLIDVDGIEVDRKLNVALTRAKDNLIITGTRSVLQKEKHYGNLITELEKQKEDNFCINAMKRNINFFTIPINLHHLYRIFFSFPFILIPLKRIIEQTLFLAKLGKEQSFLLFYSFTFFFLFVLSVPILVTSLIRRK